jgi:branched-chain amino acid transport system substrate-binding protein
MEKLKQLNVKLVLMIVLLIPFLSNCVEKRIESLKIGLVVDLSGYTAAFGKGTANSVELLKEKFKDVEFYIEDSKGDPKIGLNATNKLLNINKVDLIYCDLSTVSNAINPILVQRKKALIATVYLKSLLTVNPYAIRNLPSAEDDCRLLLGYLTQNKVKKQ